MYFKIAIRRLCWSKQGNKTLELDGFTKFKVLFPAVGFDYMAYSKSLNYCDKSLQLRLVIE